MQPTNQSTLPLSLSHSVHATPNTGNGLSINNHLLVNSLNVGAGQLEGADSSLILLKFLSNFKNS